MRYALTNRKTYIPKWSPKTHIQYSKEFRDYTIAVLALIKRLNERESAKVCKDMKQMLVGYIASLNKAL
jgi:hypothetical protein